MEKLGFSSPKQATSLLLLDLSFAVGFYGHYKKIRKKT